MADQPRKEIVLHIHLNRTTLRRALVFAAVTCAVVVPTWLFAGSVTISNVFTPGTVISAAAVNDNFAAVQTAVNDNDVRVADLAARVLQLEQHHALKVFASSAFFNGAIGTLSAADAECMAAASAGGLTGRYLAWLSDGTESPSTRFSRSGPYYRTDGARVATTWADLTDGTVENPIAYNEFGIYVGTSSGVWTGTAVDGTAAPENCAQWSGTSGTGLTGSPLNRDYRWTDGPASLCGGMNRIYCFQQ